MFYSPVIAAAAALAVLAVDPASYNAGVYGDTPNRTFYSSDAVAPRFLINAFKSEAFASDDAPRHLFIDPEVASRDGPLIFDARDLSLVYADQSDTPTWETQLAVINDTTYLAYWRGRQGVEATGHGHGDVLFYDSTYTLKWNVTAVGLDGDTAADFHEVQVTNDGTILIIIYEAVDGWDLRAVDGPQDGILMDNVIQEIDLATGKLVWEWRASEHFSLDGGYMDYDTESVNSNGYDFFHANSVHKYDDGNYLVSSRHFHSVYYLSGATGEPVWTLGGRQNNFTDATPGQRDGLLGATDIKWQHDARFQDAERTRLTFFDNADIATEGTCRGGANCSRGLDVQLNLGEMTARVVHEYYHPTGVMSGAQGGMFVVPGSGNALIAWGTNPVVTEHAEGGEVLMDVQLGRLDGERTGPGMYRAYKGTWVGRPSWDPRVALADGDVYVSWNGATEVCEWAVFAHNETEKVNEGASMLGRVNRTGFETRVDVAMDGFPRYARLAAIGRGDEILGASGVLDLETGRTTNASLAITSLEGGRNETLGGWGQDEGGEEEEDESAVGRLTVSLLVVGVGLLSST